MFFKKKIEKQSNNQLIKIAALMIHAGKIDENFSKQEEMIMWVMIGIGALCSLWVVFYVIWKAMGS